MNTLTRFKVVIHIYLSTRVETETTVIGLEQASTRHFRSGKMDKVSEVLIEVALAIAGIMLGVALSLSTCVKEDCCVVKQTAEKAQVTK